LPRTIACSPSVASIIRRPLSARGCECREADRRRAPGRVEPRANERVPVGVGYSLRISDEAREFGVGACDAHGHVLLRDSEHPVRSSSAIVLRGAASPRALRGGRHA
jgi:hypothetical protein